MPISILPVSRREFLAASLAMSGATICSLYAADGAPAKKQNWALISDSHISADPRGINRDVCMAENLVRVVGQIPSKERTGVIHMGDVALKDGQTGDYQLYSRLLEPVRAVGLPLHMVLGNHDHRERFLAATAADNSAPTPVQGKLVTLLKGGPCTWVLLDSLEITNGTPGELGQQQIEWLKKILAEDSQTPVLVGVHHQPHLDGMPTNIVGIKDTLPLLEVLKAQPQVKAVFFGHTHRWELREQDGIHFINLPPTSYAFEKGRPTGWVEAEVAGSGMKLTLHTIDPKHPAAGETHELKWRS